MATVQTKKDPGLRNQFRHSTASPHNAGLLLIDDSMHISPCVIFNGFNDLKPTHGKGRAAPWQSRAGVTLSALASWQSSAVLLCTIGSNKPGQRRPRQQPEFVVRPPDGTDRIILSPISLQVCNHICIFAKINYIKIHKNICLIYCTCYTTIYNFHF